MNCSRLRQWIERNPLSGLDAEDLEEIRAHAATCPTCADVLESAAELEVELSGLSEVDVRTELCGLVMESIAATPPKPRVESDARRTLLAHFLKNLGVVIATIALVMGVDWKLWPGGFLSLDFAFRLGGPLTSQSSIISVGLTFLACLLFLVGLALAGSANSRSGWVARPVHPRRT